MHKIINDPVHGFITIDDALIYHIISHPWYQRLRRIKQMALAYLVYPGAVHTRLHHSLGAYHLMQAALDELSRKGIGILPEERQGACIAILLHDIGHGPFSHALENTLVDVSHEEMSLRVIKKLNEEFGGQLSLALEIFQNRYPKKFLYQLISGQLDVDRLDYLARDSYFTGVSEGVIGYDRILKMITVHQGELVVQDKGVHSVEKFLIARRLMYWQVYLHKTVLSAELLLVNILKRARVIFREGEDLFGTPALKYFLGNSYHEDQNEFLQQFLLLDDSDISSAIKVWTNHSCPILSDLSRRLLHRDLFKVIFYNSADDLNIPDIREKVRQDFHLKDEDVEYYFRNDISTNKMYDSADGSILVLNKNGDVRDISQVEHALVNTAVTAQVKKHYICFAQK